MAVTRLERKGRKNKLVAKKRTHKIKSLTAKPVIKNIDVEEIKESFKKSKTETKPKAKKAKAEAPKEEAPVVETTVAETKKEVVEAAVEAKEEVVEAPVEEITDLSSKKHGGQYQMGSKESRRLVCQGRRQHR